MTRIERTTWLEQAQQLTAGAERAALAGDQVAFVAMATGAAQCLQLARLMEDSERAIRQATGITDAMLGA